MSEVPMYALIVHQDATRHALHYETAGQHCFTLVDRKVQRFRLWSSAVKRIWNIKDSQSQILALAFK